MGAASARFSRRIKKVVAAAGTVLYVAFTFALLAVVLALAAAVAPRMLGYGTIVVSGGSMGSSIPGGSLVVMRSAEAASLQVGDVIVIREETAAGPAAPKLHRIIELQQDGQQLLARTKGDANATADPDLYVLPGRVNVPVRHIPYLGFLAAFLRTPLGWAVFIALPATFIGGLAIRSIWTARPGPVPGRSPP